MTRTIDRGTTSSPETDPNRASQGEELTGALTQLVAPNPVDLSTPDMHRHSPGSIVRRFDANGRVTIGQTTMTVNIRNG